MSKCIWALVGIIIFSGLALGGYEQEPGSAAVNMSMQEFASLLKYSGAEEATMEVPEAAASSAVESADYTSQPPPETDVGELLPLEDTGQSSYVYYSGSYMPWKRFSAIFPDSMPVMWIRRHNGWSWYATMPLGTWAEMLIFVPDASPVSIYEIYPEGFVWRYDLGYATPGFYRIWYYADTVGRHECLLYSGGMFSNRVVVDVHYQWVPPVPSPGPSPEDVCESNPQCSWVDGNCYCRGVIPDNPEKQQCEQNPMCRWVNGQCLCTGLIGSSEASDDGMMGSTMPE
ncbi:MAG: hypothetical protein N3G75_02660 [Methanothrix sp.]|nr:hypothetical protein [Methanothrix sp.]MCX8206715.1 hypothetical protein [Methanothrix sp.]